MDLKIITYVTVSSEEEAENIANHIHQAVDGMVDTHIIEIEEDE